LSLLTQQAVDLVTYS